jgi:hypothetical protein
VRAAWLLSIVLALGIAAGREPAAAHTGGTSGYAVVTVHPGGVRYALTLWPATLPGTVAEQVRRAGAGEGAGRDWLVGVVRDKIGLAADGHRCRAGAGSVAAAGESVSVVVEFACGTRRELLIRDDLADALGADHHTLARIDTAGSTTQFAFGAETRETRVRLDAGPPGGRGVISFVRLGVEHILGGWDHLLFLVGLLLRGGGWLSLATIVTAFTIAHSVTLALAVLDVVTLPDRLVEAVIALSIAFVAAENLFLRPVVSRRWLVSFGFGLVHGFGFSSVLRELGLPATGLLLSLLGFNVGVELGQALVVAVALPVLVSLRRTRWEPRLIRTSSLALLLVGVALFLERVFL